MALEVLANDYKIIKCNSLTLSQVILANLVIFIFEDLLFFILAILSLYYSSMYMTNIQLYYI